MAKSKLNISIKADVERRLLAGEYLKDIATSLDADEDKTNDSNTNLVICQDRSYHRLLHKRRREMQNGLSN
jgi:hypothetical protein